MLQQYLTLDGARAGILIVLSLSQILVGPGLVKKRANHRDAVHGKKLNTPLLPWGPFFSIWLLIFGCSTIFAVWHALPQNLATPFSSQISWLAAAIFLCSTMWQYFLPRYGVGWASLAIVLIAFLHSVLAIRLINDMQVNASGIAFWLGVAPMLLYAGWLSLVSFTNLASTLVKSQSHINPNYDNIGSILILAAGFLIATIGFYSGSYIYSGAAIWGLIGIVVAAFFEERSRKISLTAGLSILLALTGTAMAAL